MLIISHKKIHWQMGSIMCVTQGMSVCPSHTLWVVLCSVEKGVMQMNRLADV